MRSAESDPTVVLDREREQEHSVPEVSRALLLHRWRHPHRRRALLLPGLLPGTNSAKLSYACCNKWTN